jgi:nitroreductase
MIGIETLLNQLNWRHATKRFDPAKKIDPLTWAALEEALILSPSSFGLQPWRVRFEKQEIITCIL